MQTKHNAPHYFTILRQFVIFRAPLLVFFLHLFKKMKGMHEQGFSDPESISNQTMIDYFLSKTCLCLCLGHGGVHVHLTVLQHLYDVLLCARWLGERDEALQQRRILAYRYNLNKSSRNQVHRGIK